MSVSLSAGIIATTASVVMAQAPTLALEESGGMLWGLSAGEIIATASVFIAFFSTVIAGVALRISVRESRKTQEHNLRESNRMRKHNHLSLKPLLNITEKTGLGKKGFPEFRIVLSNVGVGPAIIERYAVFFDDKEIVVNTHKAKEEIKRQIEIGLPGVLKHGVGTLKSIAAGASHTILYAKIEGTEANVRAFGKRLGFKIDFQSVYENEMFVYPSENSSGYPKDKSPISKNQKG